MEVKICEPVVLEKFDIKVNQYLTNAQIQKIANEVIKLSSWAEREEMQNYLILNYATNISKEEIDDLDYDTIVSSGLMDSVKREIKNIYDIDIAISYEESIVKQLGIIIEKLPEIVKKAMENGSKQS